MLSKISIDEVFMHHFEKCCQLLHEPHRGAAPGPCWGDFLPSNPLIAHPWKKFCRRPWLLLVQILRFKIDVENPKNAGTARDHFRV